MFEYQAQIVSVYDGDTVRVDLDLGFGIWIKNQPLRIYGVDSPELFDQKGKDAREFARNLLAPGVNVTVQTLKDKKEKYGRYLAKITLPDGSDYAAALVAAGHAIPYFGGSRTQDTPEP